VSAIPGQLSMVATGRIVRLDLSPAGREGPSGRDETDDITTTQALEQESLDPGTPPF